MLFASSAREVGPFMYGSCRSPYGISRMVTRHPMLGQRQIRQHLLLCAIILWQWSFAPMVHAQDQCATFGEARQSGQFNMSGLRSASSIKKDVEGRTGGKVVSFLICRPGPVYKLTVLHPGGKVTTVSVPAK